jgi:hypothetical protein
VVAISPFRTEAVARSDGDAGNIDQAECKRTPADARRGSPDNNDWIDTCGNGVIDFTNADGQEELAAVINLSIAYLQSLP